MHYSCPVDWPDKKKAPRLNWDGMAEDVTEFTYKVTTQNEIECAIRFSFVITLNFDDKDRTFGPDTKGLLTTVENAKWVIGLLEDIRKPYIIYNEHLTAPAGPQALII